MKNPVVGLVWIVQRFFDIRRMISALENDAPVEGGLYTFANKAEEWLTDQAHDPAVAEALVKALGAKSAVRRARAEALLDTILSVPASKGFEAVFYAVTDGSLHGSSDVIRATCSELLVEYNVREHHRALAEADS